MKLFKCNPVAMLNILVHLFLEQDWKHPVRQRLWTQERVKSTNPRAFVKDITQRVGGDSGYISEKK